MLTKCINVKLNTLSLWYNSGLERHIDILHKRALAFIRCILKSGKFEINKGFTHTIYL